jgi:CMP-N-acetylneuraminic acid synthetase
MRSVDIPGRTGCIRLHVRPADSTANGDACQTVRRTDVNAMPNASENVLMLVPARGDSRRLPGKCLRRIGGVPLIGRTICTARTAANRLAANVRVVVSTDDPRIADCARSFDAEVPELRPADLADAATPTAAVVRHVLAQLAAAGWPADHVVLMQPTSPLCAADDVCAAWAAYRRAGGMTTVTVRCGADGTPATAFSLRSDGVLTRGCDGIPVVLNGAVYVFTPAWVRAGDAITVVEKTQGVLMPPDRSVDVDTAADLAHAQALAALEPRDAATALVGANLQLIGAAESP